MADHVCLVGKNGKECWASNWQQLFLSDIWMVCLSDTWDMLDSWHPCPVLM